MFWVLQNNLFKEDGYTAMREVLERLGIPHSVHKVVPFVGELIPDPVEANQVNMPVICMGSYSMRHVSKREGWVPGVFDLEPFDFRVQLDEWGEHMLNSDSEVVRFQDAKWPQVTACSAHRSVNLDCAICTGTELDLDQIFVRPIEDSKSFVGQLMGKDEFLEWQHKVCKLDEDYGSGLHKNSMIQIAWPKTIYAEYRLFVIKGKIVTGSQYKRGGSLYLNEHVPSEVLAYAQERIDEWQPLDAFVIDIAEVPNLHALRYTHGDTDEPLWHKIVEINTINSSGFYKADVQKLVMAFEDAFN